MKKALKILLFIIGFPALLAFVAWKSVIVLQEGSTYSFWPYVGLILAGVIFLAYLIAFIVTGKKSKKNAGNRKKVMRQVVALVLVSFIFRIYRFPAFSTARLPVRLRSINCVKTTAIRRSRTACLSITS